LSMHVLNNAAPGACYMHVMCHMIAKPIAPHNYLG